MYIHLHPSNQPCFLSIPRSRPISKVEVYRLNALRKLFLLLIFGCGLDSGTGGGGGIFGVAVKEVCTVKRLFAVFAAGSLLSFTSGGGAAAALVAAVRAAEGTAADFWGEETFVVVLVVDLWVGVEVPLIPEVGRSLIFGTKGLDIGLGEVGIALFRLSALTSGIGSFSWESCGAGTPEKVFGRPLGSRDPRSSFETPFKRRPFRAA
jgi:hypothetical protein